MTKIVRVHTTFELGKGVLLDADDKVQLSLDCFVCRRCHRTIGLRMGLDEGICTPTNHPFPGLILSKDIETSGSKASIAFVIEFWFAPFEDIKRGGEAIGARQWARIKLILNCPRCKTQNSMSVQTNMIRSATQKCGCGFELFSGWSQGQPAVTEIPVT